MRGTRARNGQGSRRGSRGKWFHGGETWDARLSRAFLTRNTEGSCRGLLRKLAWEKAGVVRDRTGIEEALDEVAILRERIAAASSGDMGDRLMKEDLLSACFTLKAVAAAGLARNESRGVSTAAITRPKITVCG